MRYFRWENCPFIMPIFEQMFSLFIYLKSGIIISDNAANLINHSNVKLFNLWRCPVFFWTIKNVFYITWRKMPTQTQSIRICLKITYVIYHMCIYFEIVFFLSVSNTGTLVEDMLIALPSKRYSMWFIPIPQMRQERFEVNFKKYGKGVSSSLDGSLKVIPAKSLQ